MPLDKGLGLDDDESIAPIEKPRQRHHRQPRRMRRWPRLQLAFLERCQLFPQEQILGDQRRMRGQEQPEKGEQRRFYNLLSTRIQLVRSFGFYGQNLCHLLPEPDTCPWLLAIPCLSQFQNTRG
jgi:hypothetical protein